MWTRGQKKRVRWIESGGGAAGGREEVIFLLEQWGMGMGQVT